MIRNEKGVTLVELLIVIVILGIIAAISVPAVGNIVSNAEKDALLSDATNIQSAAQLACNSEDWDACDDQDGADYSNDDVVPHLGNTDDGEDNQFDLSSYIEDFDGDFVALRIDGEWIVAIQSAEEDYTFVGNPQESDRSEVDATDWDGTSFPLSDGDEIELGTDDEDTNLTW